jgi:predicted enzyme related to lactoylglutathione lyase
MFERFSFSERARQVVVFAHDEARGLGHDYVGTEHLLLGLLREGEGVAALVLASLGATIDDARARVDTLVGRGGVVTTGQMPFTPRAKKVLELALKEARSLGHDYIGTEHILLGLARENEGIGALVLLNIGVDADDIRDAVMVAVSGRQPALRPTRDAGAVCNLVIPADDPARSAEFYRDVFGWRIWSSGGLYEFEDAQGRLSGWLVPGRAAAADGGTLFSVRVVDVDAASQAVAAHGGEPVDAPPGLGQVDARWFRDPGGNIVGLSPQ